MNRKQIEIKTIVNICQSTVLYQHKFFHYFIITFEKNFQSKVHMLIHCRCSCIIKESCNHKVRKNVY